MSYGHLGKKVDNYQQAIREVLGFLRFLQYCLFIHLMCRKISHILLMKFPFTLLPNASFFFFLIDLGTENNMNFRCP